MIASLIAGFTAGSVHVMAGPDHLAAVAPLAIRRPRRAWFRGAQWGIGHLVGVGVLTSLFWWLRDALPLERLSAVSEQLVGVFLVAIGLWALRVAAKSRVHVHEHQHDGQAHVHIHAHASGHHPSPEAHKHHHASLWLGVLHGVAGSAHFLAVVPALAFPARIDAAAYLVGYGVGTIVAMSSFAAILGIVSARAGVEGRTLYRTLVATAGAVAIVVGTIWLLPAVRF